MWFGILIALLLIIMLGVIAVIDFTWQMFLILMLVILLVLFIVQLPAIIRYMKIRSM